MDIVGSEQDPRLRAVRRIGDDKSKAGDDGRAIKAGEGNVGDEQRKVRAGEETL